MGRKILFITTDQQRFDSLGCNGGSVARTPVVDQLAADGIRYTRAHPQSVVCMPSRSTMITGQHVASHGVWMNGVALPVDAPSAALDLWHAGYRTALFGKAHFEPFLDPFLRFTENSLSGQHTTEAWHTAVNGERVPHRGLEHMEFATHGGQGLLHYARWLRENHPEAIGQFFPVLDGELNVSAEGGGDTDAPQVKHNPIPRDQYHTDWVAERAIAWLDGLDGDDDWFCWVSFPDPHHPWDPPRSELDRVRWNDLDLPAGYPTTASERERILDAKPRHWRDWYDGTFVSNYEAPAKWVPATLTADQVREVNAMTHIENELIDEAVGRVLAAVERRGWGNDTDVVFTTDHGEFQGDYGLLFKGPYHVDSLMRVPLIWRPAPSAGVAPGVVDAPVGHVALAATFASIAGIDPAPTAESPRLPTSAGEATDLGHERVLTEWDSSLFGRIVRLRSICRDGWVATTYLPGSRHDGSEGELYSLADDPLQHHNRWGDPALASLQADLIADLWDHLPEARAPRLPVDAPV